MFNQNVVVCNNTYTNYKDNNGPDYFIIVHIILKLLLLVEKKMGIVFIQTSKANLNEIQQEVIIPSHNDKLSLLLLFLA